MFNENDEFDERAQIEIKRLLAQFCKDNVNSNIDTNGLFMDKSIAEIVHESPQYQQYTDST